jgi:predicted RND superfamily exporter protein
LPTIDDLRRRVLRGLARVTYQHSSLVLLGAGLITLILGIVALRLEAKVDIPSLLDDSEVVRRFDYVSKNFGSANSLFILVESEKGDIKSAEEYLEALADRLEELKEEEAGGWVKFVDYKIDVDFLKEHSLFYLSQEALEDIRERLLSNKKEIESLLSRFGLVSLYQGVNDRLERRVAQGEVFVAEEEVVNELGALLQKVTEGWVNSDREDRDAVEKAITDFLIGGQEVEGTEMLASKYYLSKDKTALLMMVQPAYPTTDAKYNDPFIAKVREQVEEVHKNFPSLEIGLTGDPAFMSEWMGALWRDVKFISLIALLGVVLIVTLSYSKLSYPLFAAIPLIMSAICTLGFTAMFIGYLTIFTAVSASIIFGVGIDSSIHLISRYEEERKKGWGVREAIAITITSTGQSVVTGGLTASVAFFVLMIMGFKGLSEVGFVAGCGILTCLVFMLFLIPSLISIKERASEAKLRGHTRGKNPLSIGPRAISKAMDFIAQVVTTNFKACLIAGLIITILLSFQLRNVKFSYSWLDLQASGGDVIKLLYKVIDKYGRSLDYGVVLADNLEEARRLTDKLKAQSTIAKVESITNYLPEDQDEKKEIIAKLGEEIGWLKPNPQSSEEKLNVDLLAEQLKRLGVNIEELSISAFLGGLDRIADKSEELSSNLDELIQDINSRDKDKVKVSLDSLQREMDDLIHQIFEEMNVMTRAQEVTLDNLPFNIKAMFTEKSDKEVGNGKYIILAYPAENIWNKEYLFKHLDELKGVSAKSTGIGVLFAQIMKEMRQNLRNTSVAALLVVAMLVFADYGILRTAALSMVPVLTGILWLLGTMGLIGMKFNAVNMAAIPMIIGTGAAYGVHVIHRYRSEGRGGIVLALSSCGKAVLLSAFTTMAGFGSIALASHQGLASIGKILTMGVFFCLLISLTILPAIISLLEWRGEKNLS